MTTRYRLPDALGGAECVFHSVGYQDGCWIVELVDTVPGMRLELESSALVAVKPPPPPEPLNGSFVRAGEHYFQRDDHRIAPDHQAWWNLANDLWSTWEQVCELGAPVLLVPAPEPVKLPWREGPLSVAFNPHGLGFDGPHKVVVDVGGEKVHVLAKVARAAGRALWTAADAAEAQS